MSRPVRAVASWYGPAHRGRLTASREPFQAMALTAASRTLPFGTQLWVEHAGRACQVRVNDRGPYVRGRQLDLSWGAAFLLGLEAQGVAPVTYRIVSSR